MTPELEWKLEIEKIKEQREQWQQDHDQREKHWFWQRGFWFLTVGIAIGALLVKSFG